ncbi:MAG TPA: hypothetical protein VF476_12710 [Chitinophagaceae bacterium]
MNKELSIPGSSKLIDLIFYGNYFYGICAVALSIEANLQQRIPLNNFFYFFLVFIGAVLVYTYPYVRRSIGESADKRTNWYSRNYNFVFASQLSFTIILCLSFVWVTWKHNEIFYEMTIEQWIILLIFPVVAALYYGNKIILRKYSLRNIGWLKPFVIGFTWAGVVTVYPALAYSLFNKIEYQLSWVTALLFLKNLMFVAVLCIMFDIKDYAADYISRLKTFVVDFGLRKTIFTILFPLSVIGLLSFLYYAISHDFSVMKVILNLVPFILLFSVARSLRRRRSILYYLTVVDGLMLIKAICGIIAISFFD